MRQFTETDYEALKPLESHLQRGYFGHYYYALRRPDFNRLVEIYRSLGGTQTMDYSCGRCILTLTSTLGRVYFEYKKKMEENPEPAKNAKRKVAEYNAEGELIKEFESVTKAVEETGISKGNIYKSLKESVAIDDRIFKYII
ncbi:MAG: hypothetical protein II453_14295 [Alphaproteobacteria bacterium]|nr:hypothetical protein [Alphaproteobacteria bacterium]